MHLTDHTYMNLRHFLLFLLDDLSDMDRCRLHFVLGEHIPRRLREWKRVENTIALFEYLIDTEKIFTCLVEALLACGRLDCSEKLKAFKHTPSPIPTYTKRTAQGPSILGELGEDEEEDDSNAS